MATIVIIKNTKSPAGWLEDNTGTARRKCHHRARRGLRAGTRNSPIALRHGRRAQLQRLRHSELTAIAMDGTEAGSSRSRGPTNLQPCATRRRSHYAQGPIKCVLKSAMMEKISHILRHMHKDKLSSLRDC